MALVLLGPAVLPARFYFDSGTIREAIAANAPLAFGDSYANTAFAYRLLGFPGLFPDAFAGPLTFTIAFLALVLGSGIHRMRWHPATFGLLAAWSMLIAVFVGMYSKELFAIVAIALAVAACRSAAGVAVGLLVALAYALLFRTYWVVICALWLTLLVVWRLRGRWPACLLALALVLIPLSMSSHAFAGLWLSDGRTIVLEGREGDPDSATAFANAFANTSALTDVANVAIGWLMLIFPFYLFALGAPQHVVFAAFQLYNTGLFLRMASSMPLGPGRPTSAQWQFASAMLLCVAYTVTQGMFEPDFGSFAKHEINILPAVFYLLCQQRRDQAAQAKSVAANVNAPQSSTSAVSAESAVSKVS
jgi:hypothetical protein